MQGFDFKFEEGLLLGSELGDPGGFVEGSWLGGGRGRGGGGLGGVNGAAGGRFGLTELETR